MRKQIARAAPKCSLSQGVIPQCRVLLKTVSTKDPVGATRRAVERSTTNGREPLTNNESSLLPVNISINSLAKGPA